MHLINARIEQQIEPYIPLIGSTRMGIRRGYARTTLDISLTGSLAGALGKQKFGSHIHRRNNPIYNAWY